eukprot:COSAG01_NODE_193_length_22433_cov_91.669114_3_plen_303_part_00
MSCAARAGHGHHHPGPEFEGISAAAVDLLRGLLTARPEERLPAADALEHAWFTGSAQPYASTAQTLVHVHARLDKLISSTRRPSKHFEEGGWLVHHWPSLSEQDGAAASGVPTASTAEEEEEEGEEEEDRTTEEPQVSAHGRVAQDESGGQHDQQVAVGEKEAAAVELGERGAEGEGVVYLLTKGECELLVERPSWAQDGGPQFVRVGIRRQGNFIGDGALQLSAQQLKQLAPLPSAATDSPDGVTKGLATGVVTKLALPDLSVASSATSSLPSPPGSPGSPGSQALRSGGGEPATVAAPLN